jgi:pimeloyl-ACP methyl ester carboxylesterase
MPAAAINRLLGDDGPDKQRRASSSAHFCGNLQVREVRPHVGFGRAGPAALLVHGASPNSHDRHRAAPGLPAAGYQIVCPDLRGFGQSSAPRDQPDHAQASRSAMAADLAQLMRILGHEAHDATGHAPDLVLHPIPGV